MTVESESIVKQGKKPKAREIKYEQFLGDKRPGIGMPQRWNIEESIRSKFPIMKWRGVFISGTPADPEIGHVYYKGTSAQLCVYDGTSRNCTVASP